MGNLCRPPAPQVHQDASGQDGCFADKLLCFASPPQQGWEANVGEVPGTDSPVPPRAVRAVRADCMMVDPPQFQPSRRQDQGLADCAVSRDNGYGMCRVDSFIGESVDIHLYDLSDTLGHLNSVALDLLGLGGALHVGLEVMGEEWSFGMHGVTVSIPKRHQYYAYRRTVHLGRTYLKRWQVEEALAAIQEEWLGSEYDIFSHNCGHFCNSLAMKLGVQKIPAWVTSLPEAMGKLPGGRTLADAITRATIADDQDNGSEPGDVVRNGFDDVEASLSQAAAVSPVHIRMGATETSQGSAEGLLRSRRCEAFRESQEADRREALDYSRKHDSRLAGHRRSPMSVMSMAARGGA